MSAVPEMSGGGDAARDRDERARMVRLCTLLTGDGEAAEDLAQEVLLEAWRLASRLLDPSGRAHWLSAIARNVCLRWRRRRAREGRGLLSPREQPEAAAAALDSWLTDDIDLDVELERGELAELLDRALARSRPSRGHCS